MGQVLFCEVYIRPKSPLRTTKLLITDRTQYGIHRWSLDDVATLYYTTDLTHAHRNNFTHELKWSSLVASDAVLLYTKIFPALGDSTN